VRDFRSHAVQLQNGHLLAPGERIPRWDTQIEAAEIEAVEPCGNVVDGAFERRRQQRGSIVEASTAAVASAVAKRDHLPCGRHLVQTIRVLTEMEPRHPDGIGVREYQLLDRLSSIAFH